MGGFVLTHATTSRPTSRDLAVRNAFGESYSYALCPRHDDVRDYCSLLDQRFFAVRRCGASCSKRADRWVLTTVGPTTKWRGALESR